MTEALAFRTFVALVMGGLAVLTLAIAVVAIVLLRRNRRDRSVEH